MGCDVLFCILAKVKGPGSKVIILPGLACVANLGEKAREIHVLFHGQGKSSPSTETQTWNVVGLHSKVSLGRGEAESPDKAGCWVQLASPVRRSRVFSAGFRGVLQATFRMPFSAPQRVGSCERTVFRFASQGKSCYIKVIQDCCPKNLLDKI